MLQKVNDYIAKNQLFHEGAAVIAAVSGGPDSVALLHILKELVPKLGINLTAAHLNHQLRDEAGEEEEFVRSICQEWQIPFRCQVIDVRKEAADQKKGIEEAARDCRYQYFEELKQELQADYVATAHHRDDQAETILLHMLRGSGIKGLRGILPSHGYLMRPLLGVTRSDIEKYLEENLLSYRMDSSNYDLNFLRNRVRHELIPYLQKEYNPRIIENLDRLGLIAREENQAMETETDRLMRSAVLIKDQGQVVIDNKVFQKIHPAFQRRIILSALGWLQGDDGWSALDVQLIMDLNRKPGSAKKIKLRKNIWVSKVYDQLIIGIPLEINAQYCYPVRAPGSVYIQETGDTFCFAIITMEEYQKGRHHDEIYLDHDKLAPDIFLRSRKAGDRISLPGMKGRKKIKDYFIDKKVPLIDRSRIPLLSSQDEVYAIVGHSISQKVGIDEKTTRVLVIRRELDEKTK
ncbi:trna(ile)-lysidine synthetase [hydrocarbon metagenome]|uniref:tRNA(Ile)-lysidine synthetase n=1 Tax=hydrocarbon metagenome TaxID=938273 RepID=A0A0W8E9D1_9ZZZZ